MKDAKVACVSVYEPTHTHDMSSAISQYNAGWMKGKEMHTLPAEGERRLHTNIRVLPYRMGDSYIYSMVRSQRQLGDHIKAFAG